MTTLLLAGRNYANKTRRMETPYILSNTRIVTIIYCSSVGKNILYFKSRI